MRISDWSSDVCSSDLGSPLFQGVTLTMPNGKTLTIEAENNGPENVYIQSVTLNGQPHARTFLTHEALSQGGTLTFVMGPTPNKQRPEERRVGKEGVSTGRSRGAPYH